jgi:hypothetical protein
MLLDAGSHIAKPAPVVEAFNRLNFPLDRSAPLGIIALVCVIVYAIPQTSILGAILLTGYLGGAVATHFRARDPLFDTIFPIIFGVLVWLGVYLRNAHLRTLLPMAKSQ